MSALYQVGFIYENCQIDDLDVFLHCKQYYRVIKAFLDVSTLPGRISF